MILEPEWLLLLAGAAFLAGVIDTLAGGGGLITIPAFMFAGMPPAVALATNKCQAFAGTLTASLRLIHTGHLDFKRLWPYALVAFLASLSGAYVLSQSAGSDWLEWAVPLLLLGASLYFGFVNLPNDRPDRVFKVSLIGLLGLMAVGFYDGFFGPGTGSLFALLLITVMGLALREATIHAKLFNAMTNLAAFCLFAWSDLVVWSAVAVMIPAQIGGALIGTRFILGRGIRWVRPLVVFMCSAMAIKLASEVWLP